MSEQPSSSPATAPNEQPPRTPKKKKPWYIVMGRKVLKGVDRFIARHSLVGDPAFFDPADFAWTRELEANWPVVRAELDEILRERDALPNFQDISEDQKRLSKDNQWKTFFLYGYGYKMEENCVRCPETTRLVERVPGMKTAFFSILAPGKHIPAHRGPYKGVMRYHLGLSVPEPRERCRIRVGHEVAHWEEGKSMLFDDTYNHEVWNDTDGVRVVLFMDVVRPMRFPASLVNRMAFTLIRLSPYVQRARRNQKRWLQRQRQAQAR
ncbi:aspartyl/asparaginyl beta-hydroxylase domain-containing protein [Salinicola salarius]|uniref:aspartyl/asparaginyl beta-hydroxylase domain-containing protein n=1 Tax=Salinicola salarius TaxID=430457 RepID=UPI000B406773|nr:aspartyl/asparaginyl beta-hydroxylase domain-containing protein [Salinicola salarius]